MLEKLETFSKINVKHTFKVHLIIILKNTFSLKSVFEKKNSSKNSFRENTSIKNTVKCTLNKR